MADDVATAAPQRVTIVDKSGARRNIDPSDLQTATQAGYHLESDKEYSTRKKEEKFGGVGGQLAAGALGAARGLTLGGMSDVAIAKLGVLSPDTLRDIKETNPIASGVGEAAGTIGGAFIGGGVGSGVKLGASVAGAAESGVVRLLGESAMSKFVAKAIGAGAEGALYGAGQALSEDAIGEHQLTAEHLVSTIGLTSLLSGGMAGAMHGAGKALKAAARFGAKAGEVGSEAAASAYGQAAEKITGGKISGDDFKAAVGGKLDITPEYRNEISNNINDSLDNIARTVEDLGKKGNNAKHADIERILSAGDMANPESAIKARDATDGLLQKAKSAADEMLDQKAMAKVESESIEKAGLTDLMDGTANSDAKRIIHNDYDERSAKSMFKRIESFEEKMTDLGGNASSHDTFKAVDDFKKDIAEYAQFDLRDDQFKALAPYQKKTIAKARDLYHEAQQHLESPEVYGEAGARQASFNEATRKMINTQNELYARFGNVVTEETGKKRRIDPIKVNTFLNQISEARGRKREHALDAYLKSAMGYIEAAGPSLRAVGDSTESNAIASKISQLAEQRMKATEALGQIAKMRALGLVLPNLEHIGMVAEAIPGMHIVSKVAQQLQPQNVINILSKVNKLSKEASHGINNAVDAIMSSKVGKQAGRIPVAISASIMGNDGAADAPGRTSTHKQALDFIQLASDPAKLQDVIAKANAGFDQAAPKIAGHVATTQSRAVSFLASKAPRPPPRDPLMPKVEHWNVPKSQLSSFERYLAAVNKPMSILDDVRTGHLSHEGVEAVATVYPQVYQQILRSTVSRLQKLEAPPNAQKRAQLSLLLGLPIEPLLQPENLAIVQQSLSQITASVEAAEQNQQKAANMSGSKIGQRAQSSTDKLMEG